MLVKPEGGTHWYKSTGEPRYGATLREARKEILYPSVTTVLQVLAKPGLESWKQEQAIMAALTLPRKDGEGLDEFAKRVVADSQEQSRNAAAKGDQIHAGIDAIINGRPFVVEAELVPVMGLVREWLAEHEVHGLTEAAGVGSGFGGRIDFFGTVKGEPYILDFKSQWVKKSKPATYSTWMYQGAAYRQIHTFYEHGVRSLNGYKFANLVINTDPDNPAVWFIEHTEADMKRAEKAWLRLLDLWYIEKNYYPTLESEALQ